MSRRNPNKPVGKFDIHLNGWLIEPQPITFACTYPYIVFALNAEGFIVEEHGFQRLRDAKSFCALRPAPRARENEA